MHTVSLLSGLFSIGKILLCFDGCLLLIVSNYFNYFIDVGKEIISKRTKMMNLLVFKS